MITTILAFIIVFGLIVFVHELGHFAAAKLSGVGVNKFAFGFPPRLWSKKFKGTEYAINLIPLGGYVKLEGEDEETEEIDTIIVMEKEPKKKYKKNSLQSKGPLGLIFIFSSGVVMNILLTIILLAIGYSVGMQSIYPGMWEHDGINNTQRVRVAEVEENTPAKEQGLKAGDLVIEIEGKEIFMREELLIELDRLVKNGQKEIQLTVERDGAIQKQTFSTYKSKVINNRNEEIEVERIGFLPETVGEINGNIFDSIRAAVAETFKIAKLTFQAIFNFFSLLATKLSLSEEVVGPAGIIAGIGYYASLGPSSLLQLTAVISISVAIFNILPIPALDGGFVLLTAIEAITKRKLSLRAKNAIQLAGFAALIGLMVVVTFRDLSTFGIFDYVLKLVRG